MGLYQARWDKKINIKISRRQPRGLEEAQRAERELRRDADPSLSLSSSPVKRAEKR